jgi:hypothetical protein
MKIFKSFLDLSPFKKNIIFKEVINNFNYPDNFNKAHQKLFFKDLFSSKVFEIAIFLYKDVIISNSIIFKGLSYSDKSAFHTLNGSFAKPSLYLKSLFKILFRKKIFIEECFLAVQEWGDNFYHFTLELLPQIVSFSTLHPDVPILMPLNYKSKNFITGYLSILGINPVYYDVQNVVKIKRLFVSNVPCVGVFNKLNILKLKSHIEINRLSIQYTTPFRKVYLSRAKANRRKILNESELCTLLYKFDFEVYNAEDLEISTLIKILSETKFLISNHGAGLSNILHLQLGQTIVELKASNDNYWMYFSLSKLLDHKYYYLFNNCDSNNYRDSNIDVDLGKLELLLKEKI